jgi:hypothetical protein
MYEGRDSEIAFGAYQPHNSANEGELFTKELLYFSYLFFPLNFFLFFF